MDEDFVSTSEIDRLLRGDVSDIEDLDEGDEIEEWVPEEILQERLEAFEDYMRNENVLEQFQHNDDPLDPSEDQLDDDNGINPGNDIELDPVELDNDDVPLFDRLTRKEQNEWLRAREISRWHKLNDDDDFTQAATNFNLSPPPQDTLNPSEYFGQMFDKSIIDNLVDQTNLYSVQKTGTSINTRVSEMEQFLAIHMMSGIIQMPSYRMFWGGSTRYPLIADVMSRNRFDSMRTYIHINDNTNTPNANDPNHDKLFKVRPLIDKVRENFKKIEVEEKLCVDEMVIPFKGRSVMKQYNKNKPHKWGLKVFGLASKSGMVHDFEIYVGKGTVPVERLGISGDIVLRLTEVVPRNQNYKVYIDNWFTSHALLCEMKRLGILVTGTVKENRIGRCPFISTKDLMKQERGTYDIKVDKENKIVACKWFDNKVVCLASTHVAEEPVTNVERWSTARKEKVPIPRPAIVMEYNSGMGGIDLQDMLVELYRIDFRVKRYYLRILFHLLDMSVVNAWLLYRRHWKQLDKPGKPISLLLFKVNLACALLQSGQNKGKRRGRPSVEDQQHQGQQRKKYKMQPRPVDEVRFDNIDHWPISSETERKRCKHCIKFYATWKCCKCDVFLCLVPKRNCFVAFHRK